MNKKALSFIEVLISVAIIVILATVGLAYKSSYDENKFNAKITADTSSLKNSFIAYKQENGEYPKPGGNINYFKKDSSYSHDENGAYGVHGFVTNEMISKKYINYLPLDPRVNQFYAYGKTLDNNAFEISSVIVDEGEYITKVDGNYNGQEIVGLIREYNGPQFLYDNITNSYPYNPIETKMTARIASYTGSVSINGDSTNILTKVLTAGTKIQTSANSNAEIFYSDGSRSILEENSSLEIKEMTYKDSNQKQNLLTSVKLFLENGTVWTKASRLNQDGSEFEITTQDATAAVRGTIFGVQRKNGQTNINLIVGKIDIKDPQGNLIEELIVTPGNSEIQRSIENGVKQATITPIHFIDKEEIFPSNVKLQIESIKEDSGKKINIVNTFSKGKLFVNYQPFTCNNNGDLLECRVGTIQPNSEIVFCNTTSPENHKSCTKAIKIGNLVYNNLKENLPTNNDIENISNLASSTNDSDDTSTSEDSGTSSPSGPSYTPCDGSFTPGCIVTLGTHNLQLTSGPHNGNGCGGVCGGGVKGGSGPFDGVLGITNHKEKRCKNLVGLNGESPRCAKKRWGWKGKTIKIPPFGPTIKVPEYTYFDTSFGDSYTYTEVH